MWLLPDVIALSLQKTIDWGNFKILETCTEKQRPKIRINTRYQISHASQMHILCMLAQWVDFEMCIHVWSLKHKGFWRPQYACQKDMFAWVYVISPRRFLPLTFATGDFAQEKKCCTSLLQSVIRTHQKVLSCRVAFLFVDMPYCVSYIYLNLRCH